MSASRTEPGTGLDLRHVLAQRVPAAEAEALASARFLTLDRRVLITLVALGDTHARVAAAMGTSPERLRYLLASSARRLRCPARRTAVVHTTYLHAPFPLPRRADEPPPRLRPLERRVLFAYARGTFQRQLAVDASIPLSTLYELDERLRAKVGARSRTHIIRRAWQLGLFTRSTRTARRLVPDVDPLIPVIRRPTA
ncbi:hypothetical protein [Streptomyces sp. NPDC090025]|uniref:hypothetical protein n=1 Tax=Streptomyces sp. NPDC090025 TaxID=3365922 RepID=UPI003833DB39